MMRIFALASFVFALSVVPRASGDSEIIYTYAQSDITLWGERVKAKVTGCTLEKDDGQISEVPDEHEDHYCRIRVWNSRSEYAGNWTLTTHTDDGQAIKKGFTIIVTLNPDLKPATYLYANSGQWVTVWFEGNDTDVTACKLKATMMDEEYDLFNYQSEEISLYRKCGVKMLATKDRSTQWDFRRNLGEFVVERATFRIQVPNNQDDRPRVLNRRLIIGKPAQLQVQESDILFCQFTRPDGTRTRLQYGNCLHKIPTVTTFHYGTWIASFALKGKMEMDSVEFHVELWDLESLDTKIITGPGSQLNLLCRTGVPSLKFCTFIRPDKYTINLPVGVGNENYSYYGDGYKDDTDSRYYADCGITIHNPSDEDFGSWNCEMGVQQDDNVETRGTVINVDRIRSGRAYEVESSDVIVKQENSFTIRCDVNAKLDYCWLTSPNGTVYSISPEKSSHSRITYVGKGFTMGHCGAIINSASLNDSGKWDCHLGLSDSTEVVDTISVQVTDSYIIATENSVQAKDAAKLSCRTFLAESGTLKYCRWVRPDGYGISYQDAWRYSIKNHMNSCDLNILNVTSEDIGAWTCVGMLTGTAKMEQTATVELKALNDNATTTNAVTIILACGLLVITLLSSFFAAMFFCKRHRLERKLKRPPAYDPEDYKLPRALPTMADQPVTADKDYKY